MLWVDPARMEVHCRTGCRADMLVEAQDPLPLSRSCRRPQYWLLDVQRAARAKFGSEAAMLRQARRNKELASRPHRANSSGQVSPCSPHGECTTEECDSHA